MYYFGGDEKDNLLIKLIHELSPTIYLFVHFRPDLAYFSDTDLLSRQPRPVCPSPDHSSALKNWTEVQVWRQSGGILVEGSTSTAGSSHASPSSTLSRPRSASENQAEIRRRLDEISSLMAQIAQPSTEITHVQELQNRIETLTEENTRLMGIPPPAYGI